MLNLTNYQNLAEIYLSNNTVIYRGDWKPEQQPVIIKTFKNEYPTLEEITQLRHEYEIAKNLDIEGIVKPYRLENYQNGLALVLEDFGGQSLKNFIASKKIPLIEFLQIAIKLAQTLTELNKYQIIHKDIKSSNIIFNSETEQVKITDFAIASRLSKENQNISNPNILEGTLAYMSPEQTGRMNRSIDYRTDYYSLGVTFYEMLTGKLPFSSIDPMELVHCHIAKKPVPPNQVNSEIPAAISDIVMKLLAKNAEDRYQSALGLKYDLEFCLTQLQATGKITNFTVGAQDLSGQLLIPQKLYGREQEVEILLAAFERVATVLNADVADVRRGLSRGFTDKTSTHPLPELVLVSGYSGIGKSSLVNEIQKPIVQQRGYFIKGKFDQFKRNIPYAAIIQAFQELIQQLLTENKCHLATWKEKMLNAIGANGQVIIDVIPEVELIIGAQPPVPQLGATESQNRFNQVFKEFIHVFTKPEHPLVLFLDDLQWADSASLNLIQLVTTDSDSHFLLLIGAYRDNEVIAAHPLMQTLEKIQETGAAVNNIILKPLNFASVNQIIAETLYETETVETRNFASLLCNKTAGNPFFLTQLLQTLYQEKLLTFNFRSGQWQWDIEQIQAIGITDKTVVELVASNIQKLPEATQKVLNMAACIGNSFSLDVLAIVNEKSQTATAADLWAALQAGLILPLSNAYKIPLVFDQHASAALAFDAEISYKFLHDRVQQAAYSLIPEDQKKETHLKIGQLLLKNSSPEERETNIFNIVNQLNVGVDVITEQAEKYHLAELNLVAGKKAKASLAYFPAFSYLKTSVGLLGEDSWHSEYNLTLDVYVEAAEAAYLSGDFEQTEQWVQVVLQQGQTLLDKVKAYEVKIQAYIAQSLVVEAVKTALQVLKLLGVNLPESPHKLNILLGLVRTKLNLAFKRIEDFYHLPKMTDPPNLAAMRIINSIVSSVLITVPELLPIVVFKQVNLSVKYGNAPASAFAYANYALILCGFVGDIESGYKFGQLALSLIDKLNANSLKAKTSWLVNFFVKHWKEHVNSTLTPFLEGYQSGLATGDLEYAAYCTLIHAQASFVIGRELVGVEQEMANCHNLADQLKQEIPRRYNGIFWQTALNLLGRTENPCCLSGEADDESKMLPIQLVANDRTGLVIRYLQKLILCYLFGLLPQAVENANTAEKYIDGLTGSIHFPILHFYESLARLAVWNEADKSEQKRILKKVAANQKKMKKWAHHAPMNYQHKYDLVEAEKARVLGQDVKAMEYYDRAIKGASEQGYIQEEALANELAAKFYLLRGKEKIAQTYMIEAYYCYIHWGAVAKVRDLEAKYPQFLSRITARQTTDIDVTRTTKSTTTTESLAALDLSTVLKASLAISEEIVLDKLLDKLIQIVMENAGAEKALVFLVKSGKLVLAAEGSVESEKAIVLPFVPVEELVDLPVSVINYVERTKETVVVNNATQEGLFTNDPYIIKQQIKSILSLPIIYQGKLTGILYLENRLTQGAFTRDRLKVLSLLCAQVSISIENASLYKDLQSYSQELEEKNQALEQSSAREREKATLLEAALQKLQNTQLQLVQSEKMSSLGQMVAGIAHEINNPVNFINANLAHASNYTQDLLHIINLYQQHYPQPVNELQDEIEAIDLEFLREDLPKMLGSLKLGGDRIKEIVHSLRNFSRQDASEITSQDIHEGINTTLMILQHRLKAQSHRPVIEVLKEYGDLPMVPCYAGLLNQVFMNLLANAIDAIEESFVGDKGQIRIRTEILDNNRIIIRIADNGPGMTEEIANKLFNPFFTTKPVGKGTGIGLSISRQIIVEKHNGQLRCISAPGQGTEFIIELPIRC